MLREKFRSDFIEDLRMFVYPARPPRSLRAVAKVIIEPGLQFAYLMRLQLQEEAKGRMRRARLVHLLNLRHTGGEVGHGCEIGPGLVAKHPLGVIIGGGTVLGRRNTVLHNVTFGERYVGPLDQNARGGGNTRYPTTGAGCTFGDGASVLGPVHVGDSAVVGAHALVIGNVPDGATVVGVPARAIRANPDDQLPIEPEAV